MGRLLLTSTLMEIMARLNKRISCEVHLTKDVLERDFREGGSKCFYISHKGFQSPWSATK